MTEYVPSEMTTANREKLLEWVRAHGEDPNTIQASRFRVHNGRMSGFKFVPGADGNRLIYRDHRVSVPFTRAVEHPLPEFDDPKTGIYSV